MCPEYGATVAIFPVDAMTLDYLRLTGRRRRAGRAGRGVRARRRGCSAPTRRPTPIYTETPRAGSRRRWCRAWPGRAGRRTACRSRDAKASFAGALDELKKGVKVGAAMAPAAARRWPTAATQLEHGSVVIAAITSCTNTSNPSVMIGAGLVAKKAVERGLTSKPWVKTSPRARLEGGHRLPDARRACSRTSISSASTWSGYGCTTCIGNSGPLPDEIAAEIRERGLVVAVGALAATATSRAASSRTCAPTTWRRRRWSSPTRWPAR